MRLEVPLRKEDDAMKVTGVVVVVVVDILT